MFYSSSIWFEMYLYKKRARFIFWQLLDVGDGYGHFSNQHPLSLYISVGDHAAIREIQNWLTENSTQSQFWLFNIDHL